MKLIEISHNNCVGCTLCEMVCSLFHEGECSNTKSRITIFRDEEFGNNLVSLCIQCADTYCVESCPSEALSRDPKTGAVLVDENACTGCEICVAVCPLGGISYDREKGIVFKCDLCGGDPQCVQFCSRKALTFKETDITAAERKSFMVATEKLLSRV
ncbi:MAG: 4Fe-4S dicluster domain-containing protein [Chloroflexi bacterium]|nr:4Fe-4S dicluster domain-containing protein [Chloroflexota bacterium]MBI3040872.1 4Fe-4S dicluster domain-containing protein [Chloroflexota bacterium]